MGKEVERTRSHSVQFGGELNSGKVLEHLGVSGKLVAMYNGTWGRRTRELVETVAQVSDLSPAELEERALGSEPIMDIFVRAIERAGEVGDESYRQTLGRLVAAAFADDAVLDDAAFYVNEVSRLDAVHLRVLHTFFSQPTERRRHGSERDASVDVWIGRRQHRYSIAERLGASRAVTDAACARLASGGMLRQTDPSATFLLDEPSPAKWSGDWELTDLGRLILRVGLQAQSESGANAHEA